MNTIQEFVSGYEKANTKRSYEQRLKDYFQTIKTKPDHYFDGNRDYTNDLWKYWQSLADKTSCTRNAHIVTVKLFLEENDIMIQRKVWNKIKRHKKNIPSTIDVVPTVRELKQLLQFADVKARALFLLCATSGCRITEAISLTSEDIILDKQPAKIIICASVAKNDTPRITFIIDEAKDALRAWLQIRDDWLEQIVEKCNNKNRDSKWHKDKNDNTIFPFNYPTAWKMWKRLLEKSKLNSRDPQTKIHEMTVHSLRKFFMNRLSGAGVPDRYVEKLAGHEGYLGNAYRRITEEELKEYYKKGMIALLVFESQSGLIEVNEQMQKLRKENQDLKSDMNKLMTKIILMEKK
ncbi:MAG: site-specific integrase [Thermoplasmatales archaeon]|nr:site-specific integrase [Thermoplasmatales archaeon]